MSQPPRPRRPRRQPQPVTSADVVEGVEGDVQSLSRDEVTSIRRDFATDWLHGNRVEFWIRWSLASVILIAAVAQGFIVNVLFGFIAAGLLDVDQWTARTFIVAVYADLAAMVWFIVKYLFRDKTGEMAVLIHESRSRERTQP